VAGIEIQLPPPVIRKYEGSGNDPLPVESARQTPILPLLDWLGIEGVRMAGREHVALCPFHDDNRPSFRINTKRGLWYCDPCSMGGDAIDLVMRMRGSSFPDAVNEMVAR
jgi:DNA primase